MDVQKVITVGITDLCEMLDLTRSRIGQLVKMGVIPKPVSRGCYDVEVSVRGYINFLTAGVSLKGVKHQQNEEYRYLSHQADEEPCRHCRNEASKIKPVAYSC